MAKLTQEQAKGRYEESGWSLKDQYKSFHEMHEVFCVKCSTKKSIALSRIKNSSKCPGCALLQRKEELKRRFSDRKIELLSKTELGKEWTRKVLDFKCLKCNHTFKNTPDYVLYNEKFQCPVCTKNSSNTKNRTKYIEILKDLGWEHVEGEYENKQSVLTAKCKRGHLNTKPFDYFKRGIGCAECARIDSIKWNFESIANHLKDRNITLIEYEKPYAILKCNEDNHIWSVWWYSHAHYNHSCPKCYGNAMIEEKEYRKRIEQHGFKIAQMPNKLGVEQPLKVRCEEGHEFETTLKSFSWSCPECFKETQASKPERLIRKWLEEWGVEFIPHDREKIWPLELDIYIPNHKLGIEVHGTYWHSLGHPLRHQQKFLKAKKAGIDLFQVHESSFERELNIKNTLSSLLGLDQETRSFLGIKENTIVSFGGDLGESLKTLKQDVRKSVLIECDNDLGLHHKLTKSGFEFLETNQPRVIIERPHKVYNSGTSTYLVRANYDPTKKLMDYLMGKTSYLTSEKDGVIEIANLKIKIQLLDDPSLTSFSHVSNLLKDVDLVFWEDEVQNKTEIVASIILSKLGVFNHKVRASKCDLRQVKSNEGRKFINHHHIQGSTNFKEIWGLFLEEELVMCLALAFHHRGGSKMTISRVCSKTDTVVYGGLTKLLTKVPGGVITWSEDRISQGAGYEKTGFVLDKVLKPDYFYVKDGERFSKQSHRGRGGFTEKELSKNCTKVWNAGKKTWIYKRSKDDLYNRRNA